MSLINQMLQELDARGAGREAAGSLHAQVRPVPERAAHHAGWWVALVLALLLGGVLFWAWQRGTAPAVQPAPATPPRLVLKLAPDLAVLPQPMQQPATDANQNAILPDADTPAPPIVANSLSNSPKEEAPARKSKPATLPPVEQPTSAPAKLAVSLTLPQPQAKSETAGNAESVDLPMASGKQVKELTPQQRAENEYRKAILLIPQGRAAEAIAGLEQALTLDARHAAARQTLAGLLMENGRSEEAVRRLQEGLALDPGQPGMAMILARLQVEKGEQQGALETLQRTLPQAAERPDYQAFLAALLQRQGRHQESIEHYLVALRKTPQNGVWWMGLGISLQADNRLAEAQDAFGKAKASNTLSADLLAFVEQKLAQLRH